MCNRVPTSQMMMMAAAATVAVVAAAVTIYVSMNALSYSLFTFRKPSSPLKYSGTQGFCQVNLYCSLFTERNPCSHLPVVREWGFHGVIRVCEGCVLVE